MKAVMAAMWPTGTGSRPVAPSAYCLVQAGLTYLFVYLEIEENDYFKWKEEVHADLSYINCTCRRYDFRQRRRQDI